MSVRPLRRILSLQTALVAGVPFLLFIFLGFFWLLPEINGEIESRQRQLALAIVSQVESYLEIAAVSVHGVAGTLARSEHDSRNIRYLVDAQIHLGSPLKSLYVVDAKGRVETVGFAGADESQQEELQGLDLSRNVTVRKAKELRSAVWSDTFLSPVGGELVVAFAVPSGERVVMGEVELDRMTEFLRHIARDEDMQMFVIDGRGQIIADQKGRYTAQQLNISNLAIVKEGLKSATGRTERYMFNGRPMIGSLVKASLLDWHVLVAQPIRTAYRPIWTTTGIAVAGLLVAVLIGAGMAYVVARRLALRFERLAEHARRIESGEEAPAWPESHISEFDQLAERLTLMAGVIQERERQLSTLMSNLPGMVYRCANDADWTVFFVSDGCRELTGYPANSFINGAEINFNQLIHPDDRQRVWDEVQESIARRNPYQIAYKIETAQGARKWVWDHGQGIFSGSGELLALEGVILDITEQKNLEDQLRQSQKMESIGQLAGGVAHDFNNMLTGIIGSAELLSLKLGEGNPLKQYVDIIIRSAGKSAALIRKLLMFSRKGHKESSPVDMRQVITDAINILERSIDRRIEIKCDFDSGLAMVMGDSGQLENALINLGLNARDAMPDGGLLRFATRRVELDEALCRRMGVAIKPGTYLEIDVSDNGIGMSMEVQEHIFEPFFTTKEVGRGTGLGLAASYGALRDHGGIIRVQSEPGKGTTFKLYLPLIQMERPVEQVVKKSSIPAGKTLLIAEDEELLRSALEGIMAEVGVSIIFASDGQEAVETYARLRQSIDLVMLDIVMPRLGGRDAFLAMKAMDPGVRVVFTSGFARDTSLTDLMEDQCVAGFIQKPYRLHEIMEALSAAFAHDVPVAEADSTR